MGVIEESRGYGPCDHPAVRILVTGAFGYVGGRLARSLASAGHDPVLAGRTIPEWAGSTFPGRDLRRVDVLDGSAVADAVADADAVVHLAALDERESARDPALALRVREGGTRAVARAAVRLGRRVVFFSTFHVYRPSARGVVDERRPVGPATSYGVAHLAGERTCRANASRAGVAILRISNVYGAPVDPAVDRWTLAHNDLCRQAVTSRRLVLRAPGVRRDLVWVDDVARATAIVLTCDASALADPVFNVGGDRTMTIGDLADLVRERAERLLRRPVTLERGDGPAEPEFAYSSARLERLGYRPRDGLVPETDALIAMLAGGST